MHTKTYTLLLTITDDKEYTAQEVADLVEKKLEENAGVASAPCDAFEGDHLGVVRLGRNLEITQRGIAQARSLHENLRRN